MPSEMFDGSAKILSHCDRLAAHARGELSPPVTVEIDLTNVCPHRCPRCPGGRVNQDSLDAVTVGILLADLADYGVQAMVFTGGGEPLWHPEAVRLIQVARSNSLEVGLITNGLAIAKRPEIALPLVEACTWIRVSIDAGDAQTYAKIHGHDFFLEAWHAVHSLADVATQQRPRPTIGVSYLVGQETIGGMYQGTQYARNAGADYIQFRPFIEEAGNQPSGLAEVVETCRSLQTTAFSVGYLDHKYQGDRVLTRQYSRCHGCHFTAVVQADGSVPLCCLTRGKPEFYGGNIHQQPFWKIWEGWQLAGLRTIDPNTCPPLCRHDTLNEQVERILAAKPHEKFL